MFLRVFRDDGESSLLLLVRGLDELPYAELVRRDR